MAMQWVNFEPPAYEEGFGKQDYVRVMESLREDPQQALMQFGERRTTLMHAAAYDGKNVIVERLIELGADVNVCDASERTPLHDAANQGNLEVIEVLVRAGAKLDACDVKGMTPFDWGRISRSLRKAEVVPLLRKLEAERR